MLVDARIVVVCRMISISVRMIMASIVVMVFVGY